MTHKKWNTIEPTAEQVAMTKRVETALCNEINLLAKEGVRLACILTGLGVTIADLITCQRGAETVAPWFHAQAKMIENLQSS